VNCKFISFVQIIVVPMAIILFSDRWSTTESIAVPPEDDVNVRDKRVAESPRLVNSGLVASGTRVKKAPQYHGGGVNEQQLRALGEFLKQTRQLGVPDSEALALLDKELANGEYLRATRQTKNDFLSTKKRSGYFQWRLERCSGSLRPRWLCVQYWMPIGI